MIFSKMMESDLDEVIRIELENFPEPWPKESFIYDLSNDVAEVITLKDDLGNLIGYFDIYYMFENVDIGTIAVDKKYQGQKYGEKLLRNIIKRCIEKDVEFIHLEVRIDNFKAINLYKKMGFEELRIRKGYYNGVDAIDMMKGVTGLDAKDFSD